MSKQAISFIRRCRMTSTDAKPLNAKCETDAEGVNGRQICLVTGNSTKR